MPDITNLANELLCIIFLNAIEEPTPKMAHYCSGTEYPEILPFEPHLAIPPTLVKAPLNPVVGVSKNSLTTPATLSNVCMQWRKVACALSSLWSRIYVSDPTPQHVSLTRQWLERAGRRPLSLALHQSESPTSPDLMAAAENILLLFISHSSSWMHIDFRLASASIRLLDENISDMHPFPQLKSAVLAAIKKETETRRRLNRFGVEEMEYMDDIIVVETIWMKIHRARMLESITWFATWTRSDFCNDTPWSSLSQLNIQTPVGIHRILRVLRSGKQIEVLSVAILPAGPNMMGSGIDFAVSGIVLCSQLKTLQLYIIDRIEAVSFIDLLDTPSLKHLALCAGTKYPAPCVILNMFPPKKVLRSFLSRSKCRLEELRLQYYHDHDQATVAQYLTEIWELRTLLMLEVFGDISLDTFKRFSQRTPTGAHRVMPKLKSLVLTRCKLDITRPRALAMTRSRWYKPLPGEGERPPGSLRNVYITAFQRNRASGTPNWGTPLLGTSDVC